jgi:hypothetical protein
MKITDDIFKKILHPIYEPGKSTNSNCNNDQSVKCRPAVIIATEIKERKALVTSTSFDKPSELDFTNSIEWTIPSARGIVYKVENNKWEVYDPSDYDSEINQIQQTITLPQPKPNGPTSEDLKKLKYGFITGMLYDFQSTNINQQ